MKIIKYNIPVHKMSLGIHQIAGPMYYNDKINAVLMYKGEK